MKRKKVWIFAGLLLAAAGITRWLGLDTLLSGGQGMCWLEALVAEHYYFAALIYLVFTALACVFLALPGVTFAVIAGVAFGPWAGSLLCLTGSSIGAMLSFLAGRYFLKDSIKPAVMKHKALSKLLFSDRLEQEMMLLMITRLLPLFPFNLQNFAYGITDIGIVKYGVYTFLFMIPGVFLFTFATAGIIDEERRLQLFAATLLMAAVLMLLVRYVRKLYQTHGQENDADEAE